MKTSPFLKKYLQIMKCMIILYLIKYNIRKKKYKTNKGEDK